MLIGDFDSGISIQEAIEVALNNNRRVLSRRLPRAADIIRYAREQPFDLCVVVLNNLPDIPEGKSADGQAAFVSKLKDASASPIIALAGWPDDASLGKKVQSAGASCFFRLPFPLHDFEAAVRKCLRISDQGTR